MNRPADESFEEFVRSRSAHLYRLALLLTGQQADAQDLLQVVLERAYRHRAALLRDVDPEPYVRKAMVNAAIDRRRLLRRRAEHPLDDTDGRAELRDPIGQVADRDLVFRWLAALPPRQRSVLVLRFWEDLPEAEVAKILGCSLGTVKSQISRGLARLRDLAGPLPEIGPARAEVP
ncbi:MAG TPA: SigE family RNA polymerase sigma factor [Streptosporangiaceae bacterium]|nr:SigE family RNA polymerase sigma factor [Streptosporangiaceae bacterium]